MSTPAKTINMSAAGPYESTLNGVTQGSGVAVASRFSAYRPASTRNPLRPDNTRAPRGWTSSGGFGSAARGPVVFSRPGQVYHITGVLMSPPTQMGAITLPSSLQYGTMESYAIRDALGHFGEAEQRLGVATREIKETAGLVSQYYQRASQSLGRLTSDLANAKPGSRDFSFGREMGRWARGWKQVPARYLEYIYGVRPLADEIENAVDVLTQTRDHGNAIEMTLRGRYRSVVTRNETFQQYAWPGEGVVTTTTRCEAKASLVFSLPDWYWSRLPPVSAFSENWEVMRLSFVIDWVLPVKNWLRGFEGLQLRPFFKEGSTTVFLRRTATECRFRGLTPFTGQYTVPYTIRDYAMRRLALPSFPTEQVMRLPRLKNTLGLDKMDQAAALAGQRFASLGRTLSRYY